jgi:hypothetical protein
MGKSEAYQFIKVAGLLSAVPVVLAGYALAGFFLGDYLCGRFHWPKFARVIAACAGMAAGAIETVRIIRLAMKAARS